MTTSSTSGPTVAARAQAGLIGFAAAAVIEQGARMAALRGSSGLVAVVVCCAVAVAVGALRDRLPRRAQRFGPVFVAVGGLVVLCEGVIGVVFAPALGAAAVAVFVGRVVAALPWMALPGVGLGLRGPPALGPALLGAAAATLLSACASPVVVVAVAVVVALAVVADKDVEAVDHGGAGVVVAALAYVVVVVHAADASFGASVYAAATVRAVFFVALAVPLWSTWTSSTALSASAAALSLLWGGAVLGFAPALVLWPPRPTSFAGMELGRAIVVVVVVAPVALGVSALVAARVGAAVGARVGSGAFVVVGAVAAVAGVEAVGAQLTLFAAALVLAAIAVVQSWRSDERLAIGAAAGAVVVMALLLPPWPPLTWSSGAPATFAARRAATLKAAREQLGSVVVVAARPANKKKRRPGDLVVVENGDLRALRSDRETEERVARQALERQAGTGTVLLLGSGSGAGAAVLQPVVEHIDVVDGSTALTVAAHTSFRKLNRGALAAANVTTSADSLRGGLARSGVVDLIVVAARPWSAAEAADLTSAAFYREAQRHLAADGLLVQRISRRGIGARDLDAVVDNARAAFADVDASAAGAQLLLFARGRKASSTPLVDGAGDLARTLGRRVPRHTLERERR